jgi:hypothetical protein
MMLRTFVRGTFWTIVILAGYFLAHVPAALIP